MSRKAAFLVLFAAAVFILCGADVYAQRKDKDNNPPGRAGGPGTNWENKPGPQGGPGASPDGKPKQAVDQRWERKADANRDGAVDKTEAQQWKEKHRSEVNKRWEKRADANQDGTVDQTGLDQWKQKTQVDQEWEKRADTNQDGIVDQTEASQWKEQHPRPQGGQGEEGG